ncbi:MAG: GspH/FimT family pseudopilin [Rhodanobacteraceae bacterium]
MNRFRVRFAGARSPHACGGKCVATGFTLVELMVTIAVAAVLLAIAVPSFTRLMANTRQTSATNSLLNAFAYARNSALRDGQSVTVCPIANPTDTICSAAATWDTGWGVITDPAGATSVLLASGNLGAYGVAVTASGGSIPLVFTPRGLVTGLPIGTGTDLFKLCDNRGSAYAHSVVVNSGGYIQTSQTPGADPDGTALVCP